MGILQITIVFFVLFFDMPIYYKVVDQSKTINN